MEAARVGVGNGSSYSWRGNKELTILSALPVKHKRMSSTDILPGHAARPAPLLAVGSRMIGVRTLTLAVTGWLLLSQVLFLAFLGQPPLLIAGAAMLSALLCAAMGRFGNWGHVGTVSAKGFGGLLAFAFAVFLLGGEGGLFYANTDWQVRYAVLNDLTTHPWPWAYDTGQGLTILRCPVGIYLLPAIVGKLGGQAAGEFAMLVQNATILAMILALAAPIFHPGRQRVITLLLVTGFSGMDLLGAIFARANLQAHLESWAGFQYTANLTLAFWVPQHALAGWLGAVLFLLWRAGKLPLHALLLVIPAIPLLSPLAVFGVVPFVAYAGIESLLKRRVIAADIVLPALASLLAIPSLLYLSAGFGEVPAGSSHLPALNYLAFYAVEIVPFLCVFWLAKGHWSVDRVTVLIAAALMLILPLLRVGESTDFMMRAGIAPITIIALVVVAILQKRPTHDAPNLQSARRIALIVYIVGLAVPIGETARAVFLPATPPVRCGYYGVVPQGYVTYISAFDRLPKLIRPAQPSIIPLNEPNPCWNGPWPNVMSLDFKLFAPQK
jgi:hypothetical protein